MKSCDECGIRSSGAVVREHENGRDLCKDCWPGGECERCGRKTEQTTLSGKYRCQCCQNTIRGQDVTREDGQSDLERWSQ